MFSRFPLLICLIAASVLASGCGPTMPSGGGPPVNRTAPAKAFTHTTGIKFVVLPAGWSRSDVSDIQLRQPVLMSAHEVTNVQYEKFIAAYKPTAKLVPKGPTHAAALEEAKEFDALVLSHKRSKLSPGDDSPVNNVTAKEAVAFCKWLTKNDPLGRRYKLPDVAEWEYAARGGLDYKPYPSGDEIDKTKACYSTTGAARVGCFQPNGFGLYDMAGNVAEWVRTDDIPEHELRGGSWRDKKPGALRIDARGKLPPQMLARKDDEETEKKFEKLEHHGFRVLCEPPPLE